MKVLVLASILAALATMSSSVRADYDNTSRYANKFNKHIAIIFPDKRSENQTVKSKDPDLLPSSSFGLGHYSRHHFGGFGFGGYPGHYGYLGHHSPYYRRFLNPYFGGSPFAGGFYGGHHHQFHYGHHYGHHHHGFGGYPGFGFGLNHF